MERDLKYLRHIPDAIEKTERYLAAANYETFSTNDMMIDAEIRELEIIGEAAGNLSDLFIEEHADVPWHRVRVMRNVLIHAYLGANLKIVWDTCHSNLPQFKSFVQAILAH